MFDITNLGVRQMRIHVPRTNFKPILGVKCTKKCEDLREQTVPHNLRVIWNCVYFAAAKQRNSPLEDTDVSKPIRAIRQSHQPLYVAIFRT